MRLSSLLLAIICLPFSQTNPAESIGVKLTIYLGVLTVAHPVINCKNTHIATNFRAKIRFSIVYMILKSPLDKHYFLIELILLSAIVKRRFVDLAKISLAK